jgi:prolyl oligopeptidase
MTTMPRLLAAFAALAMAAAIAQPVAEVRDVPAQHHGTTVPDPYRWLEDVKDPAARGWMQAQGQHTRGLLDRIDGRAQIEQRIVELGRAGGDVLRQMVRLPGGQLVYLKRTAAERQFKLVMRDSPTAPERVVADPEVESRRTGVPHAINHHAPSWDGRFVAYGMSAGGSEDASLYVVEVATGRLLVAGLPRAQQDGVAWLPDSGSLLFNQLQPRKPGAPETEHYMDSRVLWLKLDGRGGFTTQPVFGRSATPRLKLERLDVATMHTEPGSRWVVARTTDTTVPEGKLFVAPVATLGRANTPWRAVAAPGDLIHSIALRGDTLYVMSRLGAPRRQVVAIDLARGGRFANAKPVVAEPGSGVLEWFRVVEGGLWTGHRQGTGVVPRWHGVGDAAGRPVAMPGAGAAWPTGTTGVRDGSLVVSWNSWTEPSRWLALQAPARADEAPSTQALALAAPASAAGRLPLTIRDIEFASHDGAKVPLTVMHREGLALDGSAPVLLTGYASYGFSIGAGFVPARWAWFERGGVMAFVNARGSGVHGDAWHRAGFKTTKRNTWLDGVAAARWLIANGYGSPKTMAVMGTSAGGIFAGRAATAAPELFAAAIFDVGVLDAVRAEASANGITNISEFGTVADPAEFRALLEMSTYHAIRDGTAYPGVLLVHGMNDPRVDVWHSAKTAARLQAANPGGRPALLRLDMQAGHGQGSTAAQRDAMQADIQAFMLWQMGKLGLRD